MLNRRSLLVAAGLASLNYLLSGCRAPSQALRIRVLDDAVPAQILQEFQRRLAIEPEANSASPLGAVKFVVSPQLADLFELLQTWKNPAPPPRISLPGTTRPAPIDDLIMLGDYWLSAAIQQKLIQPLPLESLAGWSQLPLVMQQLVRRDSQGQPSPTGQIWGAPYRWSSLVIAYNVERFEQLGWQPSDWSDLWRPELRRQISLLDSARATIGLTLKKLGQSANLADLSQAPALTNELEALQQQVKFYSSTDYLQPLMLGDSWLAVGWSTEVLPIAERDRRIAAVAPASGSLLSADLWVRPAAQAQAGNPAQNQNQNQASPNLPPSLSQWLEFCWQPEIASQISLLSAAASPLLLNRDLLSPSLQKRAVLLPPSSAVERSEFLLPLSDPDAYRRLWTAVRQMVQAT